MAMVEDIASGKDWVEIGLRHLERGDKENAKAAFTKAAEAGSVRALTELADMAHMRGDAEERCRLMDRAAAVVAPDDGSGHLALSYAYGRLAGRESWEVQMAKSREHLVRVAELGDPWAQMAVADYYLFGLNHTPKDPAVFEHWIQKAVAQDYEPAICAYARYLLDKKREIPRDLMLKLELIKDSYKPAKKLMPRVYAAIRKRSAQKLKSTKKEWSGT